MSGVIDQSIFGVVRGQLNTLISFTLRWALNGIFSAKWRFRWFSWRLDRRPYAAIGGNFCWHLEKIDWLTLLSGRARFAVVLVVSSIRLRGCYLLKRACLAKLFLVGVFCLEDAIIDH